VKDGSHAVFENASIMFFFISQKRARFLTGRKQNFSSQSFDIRSQLLAHSISARSITYYFCRCSLGCEQPHWQLLYPNSAETENGYGTICNGEWVCSLSFCSLLAKVRVRP